ncbi:MAG: DeoR family transcriptional regulator [Verrucomicrobiaceae bacterium]|nr:DeoR family transcriptional regulator [Verrucomicrobiaceae bacterium]
MTFLPEDSLETLNQLAHIPVGNALLEGELHLPEEAAGVVVFANSSRHSPRNQAIAEEIAEAGLGTLLVDLLTPEEQKRATITGVRRFDIELLAKRLTGVVRWLERHPHTRALETGFAASGTGTAAAIMAAVEMEGRISAIVSRGGRPDLAGEALYKVRTPTLLIVGGNDDVLVDINQEAYEHMRWRRDLRIIPGASHLFKEAGKLKQVAQLNATWFARYMGSAVRKESWSR